jgi:hypothetical protein
MIRHHRRLVRPQHPAFSPASPPPSSDRIVGELHARTFQQQHLMMGQVAEEANDLPSDWIMNMWWPKVWPGAASRCAGQEFLTVLEEDDAVAPASGSCGHGR